METQSPRVVLSVFSPARSGTSSVEGSLVILGVVILAALGTGALFLVSAIAYHRRRSRQYGLISAAIGALVVRSAVGTGTVLGVVPMPLHHLLEHALDFLIAALVLLAVYFRREGRVGRA